jgi:hypothetical protein
MLEERNRVETNVLKLMEIESQDLKNEVIEIPSTNGLVEKSEEVVAEPIDEVPEKEETPVLEPEEEAEDVITLKEKIVKLEEEKENYKQSLLSKKKAWNKGLTLESKKEDVLTETIEDYPDWDETSKKFQKQTLSEAEKVAEKKAQSVVEKYNEKAAIDKFLIDHPEMEEKWEDIVSNYNPKHGKESISSIVKDLDRAYFMTQYESGTLNKTSDKEAKSKLAEMSTVSKTSSKTIPKGTSLSKGAIDLATKMRVDTKKLAEEDDSLTAEIKL